MTVPKFRMIACATRKLYALDEDGRVWTYVPRRPGKPGEEDERFAFWAILTDHRAGEQKP